MAAVEPNNNSEDVLLNEDEKNRDNEMEGNTHANMNNEENKLMRLVCISDTHNGHRYISKELLSLKRDDCTNILIHCGDMTERGEKDELLSVKKWFEHLNFDYTLCIAGNMDGIGLDSSLKMKYNYYNDNDNKRVDGDNDNDNDNDSETLGSQMFDNPDKNIYYLENESIVINGFKFYGLPHTPRFFGGFQLSSNEDYENIYGAIDKDTDILISHGPLYNILDSTSRGKHAGCNKLAKFILKDKKIEPKVMVFGHVHPSHGWLKDEKSGIIFCNCAMNDKINGGTDKYRDTSHMAPKIIEINPNTGSVDVIDTILPKKIHSKQI